MNRGSVSGFLFVGPDNELRKAVCGLKTKMRNVFKKKKILNGAACVFGLVAK